MAYHPPRTPRPDHTAPLVLDIRPLGRRPGSMQPVRQTVPSPSRIGLDLVAIEEGADLELDLRLESVVEGVLVSGTVAATAAGECSRCLDPLSAEVTVDVTELFAYPDSATDDSTDADEVHRIVDDLVDLEPVVVDAVGLGLPLQPVCREDCPGLCAQCGAQLAVVGPGHRHETLDPRWAALASFASPDDGVEPGGLDDAGVLDDAAPLSAEPVATPDLEEK